MKPRRSWTKEEIEIIRENINTVPYKSIAAMLPGRNVDDVKTRASLEGIKRKGTRFPWRSLDESFFSKPTTLSSYWAGFLAADGCVVTSPRTEIRIGLNVKDIDHLRRFSLDCGYDGPIAIKKKNICNVTICSAHRWVEDLNNVFNIKPRKTFDLHPPNLTGDMALAYSIGFIDGDGCWAIGGGYLYLIVVGTKPILRWLAETWSGAGAKIGNPNLSFRKIWRLSLGGSKAESVRDILKEFDVPRLHRKWRVARRETTGQKEVHRNS